jgi:hypothetical protein
METNNHKVPETVLDISVDDLKEMSQLLVWALEKARSWANSKGNMTMLDKTEKLLEKYKKINEVLNG